MTGRRPERGVALLLAVLVVALLTVTIIPFFYDGRVERAVAANLYTGLQASYLAKSGVVFAEALLRADKENPQTGGYDSLLDIWATLSNVPIAAGGGTASIAVTDEQGKLNLNRLVTTSIQELQEWRGYVETLLRIQGQDPALVEALIDWVDADDTPTGFRGAELSDYLSLTPSRRPPNRPLTSVAELRLVKGWDRKVVEAITPLVTVYPPGGGTINLNTAPRQVLQAIGLDDSQVVSLLEHREKEPLKTMGDLGRVRGFSASDTTRLQRVAGVQSSYFSVVATGGFRESTAVVRVVLQRGGQGSGRGIKRIYWRAE